MCINIYFILINYKTENFNVVLYMRIAGFQYDVLFITFSVCACNGVLI